MRSDDQLLAHVRAEAGRRARRRRAVAGSVVAVVLLVGGAAAVAATGAGGEADQVHVDRHPPTTPPFVPPTTAAEPDPTTTSTTEPPSSTTTTTTTTTTTAPPAPQPVVDTATGTNGGLTFVLTATQHPDRPLVVDVTIRATTDHGSNLSGGIYWGDVAVDEFGWGITDCIPEEGDPPLEPDPHAGPIDETLTFTHTYAAPGPVELSVSGGVSICTSDGNAASVALPIVVLG